MKSLFYVAFSMVAAILYVSCAPESKEKDRGTAHLLFADIVSLTESYIAKVENAADSAAWAHVCFDFEDSLDKVNFKYPADTDLLLSEGQNDTISSLMMKYTKARDSRIRDILHPVLPVDSVDSVDSVKTSVSLTR